MYKNRTRIVMRAWEWHVKRRRHDVHVWQFNIIVWIILHVPIRVGFNCRFCSMNMTICKEKKNLTNQLAVSWGRVGALFGCVHTLLSIYDACVRSTLYTRRWDVRRSHYIAIVVTCNSTVCARVSIQRFPSDRFSPLLDNNIIYHAHTVYTTAIHVLMVFV